MQQAETAIGKLEDLVGPIERTIPDYSLTGADDTSTTPLSLTPEEWHAYNESKVPESRDKKRAGYTRNKGQGDSKARRKMAKASRRQNR